jgi:hypothetical protein
MNPQADLELLMARTEQMMAAQRDYFNNKGGPSARTWLKTSMGLEEGVRELLKQLRRKGYNPDPHKVTTEQNNLF